MLLGIVALLCSAAQPDLAEALLHEDAPGRATLVHQHTAAEIAAALTQLEKIAAARAAAGDNNAAIEALRAAIDIAEQSGVTARISFYCRQLGLRLTGTGRADLALEVYQKGIAAAEKSGERQMLVENLHGAARQLRQMGRFPEAMPYAEREWRLVEHDGQPQQQITAIFTYASNLSDLGHLREALALTERAEQIARAGKLDDGVLTALSNIAIYTSEMGDQETAARYMREVIARRAAPVPNDWAILGVLEHNRHHDAESEKAYLTAIEKAAAPGEWIYRADAMINLAILEHGRHRYDAAKERLNGALAIADEHHSLMLECAARNELAGVQLDSGDAAGAAGTAARSLEAGRKTGDPGRIADALFALGSAQERLGRDSAGDTFAEAMAVIEAMRAEAVKYSTALAATVEQWMPAYRAAAAHELHRGNFEAALRISERAKACVLREVLEGARQEIDPYLNAQERSELGLLRAAVVRARKAYLAKPGPALRRPLEEAERTEEAMEQRLYARYPQLAPSSAAIPQLSGAQLAALTPDRRTALISYFKLADELAVFVVRSGGKVQAARIPFDDESQKRLAAFRELIADRDLDYRPAARAIYGQLIGPVAEALRTADHWTVSPDSTLWDVPFQALVDPSGKHVLETHTVSYAPSLASLRLLRVPERAGIPLLAIGEDIPGAGEEASSIAKMYGAGGAVMLSPDTASVPGFRKQAGDAAVIHIAAHGEMDPGHPLESFLRLTPSGGDDGALTARQILGMRLRARLVVLSACETARGRITHGEGILGLGWAFAAAGAPATVLSQWKVDSSATRDLMIGFHRRLTDGRGTGHPEALRQAELATMRTAGHQHPFYWAAFILMGR
jgi:CHAT domain-containing protein